MDKYTEQNKTAWEFNAYDFWVSQAGTPAERAKKDLENPRAMFKSYSKYFEDVKGIKIANICDSCGKRAILFPYLVLQLQNRSFANAQDDR